MEARLGGVEQRQGHLEAATRSAASSAIQLAKKWRAPELRLAHGMLIGLQNMIDSGTVKGTAASESLGEVKTVIGLFSAELESINDDNPKSSRSWERREKALIDQLGEAGVGDEDRGMLASLLKAKKRKSKEKREKKEKKGRGRDSDSESDDSDSEDSDGKKSRKRKKYCSMHGSGKHDDSECVKQKQMRNQAAASSMMASAAVPMVATPTAMIAAPTAAAPVMPMPSTSGFINGQYYCAPCVRFHPPPPAPCYGPRGQRGFMPFAAGPSAQATQKPNWYDPFLLRERVEEENSSPALAADGPRLQLRAEATAEKPHSLTALGSLERSVLRPPSAAKPPEAVTADVVHERSADEQKSSPTPLASSNPNANVNVRVGAEAGRVSWDEALKAAQVECVEDEGDFATRMAAGPLIPEWDSAVRQAPFSLAQVEAASFNRKVFVADGLSCKFCAKSGHELAACPMRPNEKPPERQIPFVEALCNTPQIDVLSYRGKSLAEAKAMVEELGSKLNKGNPWQDATARAKRLKAGLGFWKAIGANKMVLSFIAYGIPLRFVVKPGRLAFRNHRSALQHTDWLRKELEENVRAGFCVEISREKAIVVNPLQVEPKGKEDFRMCVDARWVNFHLPTPNVRFETPQKNGPDIIGQGTLLFTADVKKAYYALEMDEDAIPYLCFEFGGKVYASLVLIFGLNLAPGLFHKVMRELVRFLRTLGVSVLNYLDDFLFSERREAAEALVEFVRWLLPKLGWLFSEDKCVWVPASVVVFFGLIVDAERFEYRVPPDKLSRVVAFIRAMRERAHASEPIAVHDLQILTGTLQSYRICVEPVQVWTRGMYADMARAAFLSHIFVGEETKEELDFWAQRLEKLNGRTIAHPLATDVLRVDASEYGWGAVLNSTFPASGFLPTELIGKSSTLRELRGLRLAAEQLASKFTGSRLRVEMDSNPAVRNLINGGGPVPELCLEVKLWWAWCEERKLQPQYVWIRREENKEADRLSKADGRKWTVRPEVKQMLTKHWALSDVEFSAPEFGAVGFVLKLTQRDRRRVGMVFPGWPAQSWWPEIHRYARQVLELGDTTQIYERVSVEKRIGSGEPSWRVFAALLDFRT